MENKEKPHGPRPPGTHVNVVISTLEGLVCLVIAALAGYENVHLVGAAQAVPAGVHLLLWCVLILALLLGATVAQLFYVVNSVDRLASAELSSPPVDRQDGPGDAL